MIKMLVGLGTIKMGGILEAYDFFLNKSVDLLTKDIFSGGSDSAFSVILGLVKQVQDVITPVSLTIVSILFLIEFIKMSIKFESLKFEHFITMAIKFGLAKGVMDISNSIMRWIYGISCDWITGIGSLGEQNSFADYAKETTDAMANWNLIEQISFNMTSGFLFPIILLSGILMMVLVYARIFEIMCYIAISPLPCAFLIQEHSRITLKFFMSYASVCLQGVFMVLSIQIVRFMAQDIYTYNYGSDPTNLVKVYNMVIISILSLFVLAKSGQWASKVLDAV